MQSSAPKGDVSRNLFDDFSSRKSGSSRPSRSSRNSQAERQRLEAQARVARAQLELAQIEASLLTLEESESEMDTSREEIITVNSTEKSDGATPLMVKANDTGPTAEKSDCLTEKSVEGTHHPTSVAALVAHFEGPAAVAGGSTGGQLPASSSTSTTPFTVLPTQVEARDREVRNHPLHDAQLLNMGNTMLRKQEDVQEFLAIEDSVENNYAKAQVFSIASPPPTPGTVLAQPELDLSLGGKLALHNSDKLLKGK